MNDRIVISGINDALHKSTVLLCEWLAKMLRRICPQWWQECVIDKLTYNQRLIVEQKHIESLAQLDLAALLHVADRNWYDMRNFAYLPTKERECIREMKKVRNNWAHCSGELPDKNSILHDVDIIIEFIEQIGADNGVVVELHDLRRSIEEGTSVPFGYKSETANKAPKTVPGSITPMSVVRAVGQPEITGLVTNIEQLANTIKYTVFIDGCYKTFYDGQILPADTASPQYTWIDLNTLQSYLSAFEINNPSSSNLYSLNSARIDFVPYQFRPALKLIKSDEPRILIADSVGVGKTIEAGLIIKELEARGDLERVLIVCPKPLVAERKWELEMKRFDEDFVPLSGGDLRQIVHDTERDGEWPIRFSKCIVPYSVLDGRVFDGDEKSACIGLDKLDPAPHFDLVIVDEAHHIRNGSVEKDKAYAYKCVKYFCDHADAVVMLTATPLQTSDNDLYTLLNVLRPDVVMDRNAFTMMAQPNEFISKCVSTIRKAEDGWQVQAQEELSRILGTQWGESVIAENPMYSSVISRLEKDCLTRDERVQLISDVESLHSFNMMINRTRRKDIQDFCVRRTITVESEFTPYQRTIHDALLEFESAALSQMHNARSVPFMMSTIKRQASSCIFGLAPYIRDIVERRLGQINDDPEFDLDEYSLSSNEGSSLFRLASNLLALTDNLPPDDPKFDGMLEVIKQKQQEENNKIILFSTFRHTLYYIKDRLNSLGYRVGHIDGSIKDEERRTVRDRFVLPASDPDALDILLFTEVGSEGLDYQFCNMMINYDLPWNPMRIEQRIGRIDRRGQVSEFVNIYNLITSDTVDADIYHRCLLRIGVFEKSIGECEEILGEIGRQIEKIVLDVNLTDHERRRKLEQMADNEVRRAQELSRLEDEEKELFGFDFSNRSIAKEIQDAESPWLSGNKLQSLIEMYLVSRIGVGTYFLGDSEAKTIRLSANARAAMREDLAKLSGIPNALRKNWEKYLKGAVPTHAVTFSQEHASKDKNAFFITNSHPLVKQAAMHFSLNAPVHISIRYSSDSIPAGEYAFSIYAWNYKGTKAKFRLVTVCENDMVENEMLEIIHTGSSETTDSADLDARWQSLEEKHINLWLEARKLNAEEVRLAAAYKLQSLRNNYNTKKLSLEQQLREATEERIIRMRQSELETANERFESKVKSIEREIEQTDIHTTLIANGVIRIN